MRPALLVLLVMILTACGAPGEATPDASTPDASAPAGDAGLPDGGAGLPDAGGGPDGGPELPDGGGVDGGADGERCPAWAGDLQLGTTSDDAVLALLALPDGLVAVGYQGGLTGVSNIEPDGDARATVWRLDLAGHLLWERSLDTPGTDVAEAVAVEPDGSLLVAGRTTGDLAAPNAGQFDVFVARLGPGGEPGPVLQLGDEGPQHPRRLALDGQGGAWLVGYDDTYVPSNFVERWENPWVARLALGPGPALALWSPGRTAVADRAEALLATAEGGAVLGGVVETGTGAGPFVLRLEADAGVRWRARLSPLGIDAVEGLAADADGGLLVAASLFGAAGSAATLLALDAEGTRVAWSAAVPTLSFPWDLATAPGAAWLAGEVVSSLDGGLELQRDAFAARIELAGRRLSGMVLLGGAGEDSAAAVAVDRCGRAFVAGFTEGPLAGPLRGGRDGFLALVKLP